MLASRRSCINGFVCSFTGVPTVARLSDGSEVRHVARTQTLHGIQYCDALVASGIKSVLLIVTNRHKAEYIDTIRCSKGKTTKLFDNSTRSSAMKVVVFNDAKPSRIPLDPISQNVDGDIRPGKSAGKGDHLDLGGLTKQGLCITSLCHSLSLRSPMRYG